MRHGDYEKEGRESISLESRCIIQKLCESLRFDDKLGTMYDVAAGATRLAGVRSYALIRLEGLERGRLRSPET